MRRVEVESALAGIVTWTPDAKAALDVLHARARKEAAASTPGPYVALEHKLFGDPGKLLETDEEEGPGFGATLIEGPDVCYFRLAGIENEGNLNDKVWQEHNWRSVLSECSAANEVELYETDNAPGMSDTYYWICVRDADELARQLREFIVGIALEPPKPPKSRRRR